jgi:hypothetical protein
MANQLEDAKLQWQEAKIIYGYLIYKSKRGGVYLSVCLSNNLKTWKAGFQNRDLTFKPP